MAVIVALGTNLGDRLVALRNARARLMPILVDLVAAPVYETAPLYVTAQPKFLNTVLGGTTKLTPSELLQALQAIEGDMGRVARQRNGPREIDLDIVYYDDVASTTDDLTIPHPLRRERRFVLQPLADIAPELIDPVTKQTVRAMLAQLPPDPTMMCYAATW
jgi:2-amino-4-hydroxy-6-hydroxymethyldihydropteridine diphosphokinase